MARHELDVTGFTSEVVLLPTQDGGDQRVTGVRLTVYGSNFPQRAVAPELLVGRVAAENVTVSPNQSELSGYFRKWPTHGGRIRVRYGQSLEGVFEERFDRDEVRPLPETCGTN
jgi:hypothetical protein